MSQPAARIGDMHTCPQVTPGTPPVPHVGGLIITGYPTVLIGGPPAARVTDMATCVGPPDTIMLGSFTVLIGGQPAARVGDTTAHGGIITVGLPTVLIGSAGMAGNPDLAAQFFPGQQANKDTCALMSAQGVADQATGMTYTETEMQGIGQASGAYTVCNGTTNEAAVMTQAGVPATMHYNPALEEIALALAQGRAVIVGLDARALWNQVSPTPLGHAVRVTGAESDADGNVTALYINDTGTGIANQRVPAATFQQCLDDWGGGRMATSDNPVP